MKYMRILFLLACLTAVKFNLIAGGADFLPVKNSRTMALNGIYLAGADGVIGSRFNPAILSNLTGFGIEITAVDKLGDQSIESLTGDNYESFRNDDFLIAVGFYYKILNNLAVGVSYSPDYRFDVDWPLTRLSENEASSLVNAYDLKNNITIRSISPTLSYNLGSLAIGVSANIYQGKLNYTYPIMNSLWDQNIGLPGYDLIYDIEGWSYGVTFGLLYQMSKDLTFAFAAQSSTEMNIDGALQSNFLSEIHDLPSKVKMNSKWEIPWKISIGGIYKLNPNLAVNIDLSVNLYSSDSPDVLSHSFENSEVSSLVSDADTLTGLSGSGLKIKFNNSFNAGIGIEYVSSDLLSYRFGYLFNQSAQDNSMYGHLFPNIDQHWINAGIGISQNRFLIDITLSYAVGIGNSVDEDDSVFGGKYSSQLLIPSLTIKYTL